MSRAATVFLSCSKGIDGSQTTTSVIEEAEDARPAIRSNAAELGSVEREEPSDSSGTISATEPAALG